MNAMICQPMNGIEEDFILSERQKGIKFLEQRGYNFISSYFEDYMHEEEDQEINISIKYLAKALSKMSICNAVLFMPGWADYTGCKIKHAVAKNYGLDIIYYE